MGDGGRWLALLLCGMASAVAMRKAPGPSTRVRVLPRFAFYAFCTTTTALNTIYHLRPPAQSPSSSEIHPLYPTQSHPPCLSQSLTSESITLTSRVCVYPSQTVAPPETCTDHFIPDRRTIANIFSAGAFEDFFQSFKAPTTTEEAANALSNLYMDDNASDTPRRRSARKGAAAAPPPAPTFHLKYMDQLQNVANRQQTAITIELDDVQRVCLS